jgi:hypothetical protein
VSASVIKGNGGGLRAAVGNVSAPWLALAFFAGAYAGGRRIAPAALVGAAATAAALLGFYVSNSLGPESRAPSVDLRPASDRRRRPAILRLGALSGPVFAALGRWQRPGRGLPVALVPALAVFEPLATLLYGSGSGDPSVWLCEIVLGIVATGIACRVASRRTLAPRTFCFANCTPGRPPRRERRRFRLPCIHVCDSRCYVRGESFAGRCGAAHRCPAAAPVVVVAVLMLAAIVALPDQGPVASSVASAALLGSPTSFDGSASSDSSGAIAGYAWNLGDGTPLANGGPTASHTYAAAGTYTATLAVTDQAGCSSTFLFNGQTAFCNGGPAAVTTRAVTVSAPPSPRPTPRPSPTPGRLSIGGAARVVGNNVQLNVACAGQSTCAGKLELDAIAGKASKHAKKPKLIVVAKGRYSVPAGKTRTIELALTKAGEKLLSRHHGKLTTTLKVTPTAGRRATHKLKLVRQKKHTR